MAEQPTPPTEEEETEIEDYADEEPERDGPPIPTDEEVRELFRALFEEDPTDDDIQRYTGQMTRQAKELMIDTDEAVSTIEASVLPYRHEEDA